MRGPPETKVTAKRLLPACEVGVTVADMQCEDDRGTIATLCMINDVTYYHAACEPISV